MACQMMVCYARVMKANFRPYVDEASVKLFDANRCQISSEMVENDLQIKIRFSRFSNLT
jgi:hypothetical protein